MLFYSSRQYNTKQYKISFQTSFYIIVVILYLIYPKFFFLTAQFKRKQYNINFLA